MPDEWIPAAPDLGENFRVADRGFAAEPRRSPSTEPVTIDQLAQLESGRSAPVPGEHLRPGDFTETAIHRELDRQREGEILYVAERLCAARNEMRDDFERGRNFEREPGGGKGRER